MSVSDSDDSGSLNSMLHVRASELYPKKEMKETQESASIAPPFVPLCGESIEYISRITEGVLVLSNYRIYYQRSGKDGKGDFNIPLGLIEMAEIKELFHIYFNCKNARTYRCSFPSNDVCVDWFRRIQKAVGPPKTVEELFAFAYYAWTSEEGSDDVVSTLVQNGPNPFPRGYFEFEFNRLGFRDEPSHWRITSINSEYQLCSSYPQQLIVPKDFSDSELEQCAKFRSSSRVPAIVWRHRENGMVIARSSQPEVGWFCWRSAEDEKLLKHLSDACGEGNLIKPKLLVMDARSYTTAVANRARGGGCECQDYYSNIEIKFMNLANIHSIRKSFQALRLLCASGSEQQNWYSMLENTKWLSNMSLLIEAAVSAVTAIEKDAQPVLVHCSDGWDRTTQIVSLAELLLDPYYRTIEGFQVLCEKEWLDFGHKFADRCGIGEDVNEKCPVFLQWLDCVHNISLQFPCAFEFSKRYLIKLAEHTYSNLFGTFFCNTRAERQNLGIPQRTYSVWKFLSVPKFRNYLYDKNCDKVLYPKFNVRDLEVWRDLYVDLAFDNQYPTENESLVVENTEQNVQQEVENGTLNNLGNKVEPMLLSAINSCPDGESGSHVIDFVSSVGEMDDENVASAANETSLENLQEARSDVVINGRSNDENSHDETSSKYCNNNSNNNSDIATTDSDHCEDIATLDITENSLNVCDSKIVNTLNIEEDCDILTNRKSSENSEDCSRIVDELEMRLMNEENSVQSSVETVVDNNFSDLTGDLSEYKSVTNGLKNCDQGLCHNSRQQYTSLLLDPIDGLPLIPDDIQDRLQQICIEHKAQLAAISNELHKTRNALVDKLCHQCTHIYSTNPVEKQIVSDDDKGSVCSTEVSWEAVDEKDVGQVLWVPDYAVNFCTACNSRFWIGRRKHHCRGCGKIFCADCSRNVTSLPNEQLFDPVRVCEDCYHVKRVSSCLSYSESAKQITCKQAAAGEEPRNSNNLVLPPTPPI